MSLKEIKDFLALTGAHAKKNFSQNFLYNDDTLYRIMDLVPSDKGFYVEIGGGLGSLTALAVAKKLFPLTVADLDDTMLTVLRRRFGEVADIVSLDGTKIDFSKYFRGTKGFVFGNLPYQVSSPILVNTCFENYALDGAIYLLQKEVAEKFVAQPGSRDFGPVAALIKLVGSADYIFTLSPEEFFPAPKVHSAVLKITFSDNGFKKEELVRFTDFMRVLFSNRRKTLSNVFKINNLNMKILEKFEGIAKKRAEELEWEMILKIADEFKGG